MDDTIRHDSDVRDTLDLYISPKGWTNEWTEIVERSRHRRRRTRIVGTVAAVLAGGTLAALTVALIPDGSVTRDGAPSSTGVPNAPVSAITPGTDGFLGATDLVSVRRIDPVERHESANMECVTFTIAASGASDAISSSGCLLREVAEREGYVSRRGSVKFTDRPELVFGLRPAGSTSVVVKGVRVQEDGPVFSAVVPPTMDVVIDFMDGETVMRSVTLPSRGKVPWDDGASSRGPSRG